MNCETPCETARILRENNDPALEEHLRSCLSCVINLNAPYYEAPAGLETTIRERLRSETAPLSRWRWIAIAASVLLAASIVGNVSLLITRTDPRQLVADEVLSAHIRSLAGTHLLDVPSSDQHTVKPWFNGKLDFSPPVKFLADFPLLGGRLEYLAGHPVAALVYGRNKHVINLFLWPATMSGPNAAVTRNGYHLQSWSANGMSFWAVSDLDETELRRFAAIYKQT